MVDDFHMGLMLVYQLISDFNLTTTRIVGMMLVQLVQYTCFCLKLTHVDIKLLLYQDVSSTRLSFCGANVVHLPVQLS